MVLSWLMEYALKYDLNDLRNELKTLFPQVIASKLDFPEKSVLTDLATLRLISRSQSDMLDTAENLRVLIDNFSTWNDCTQLIVKPSRKKQLQDFLQILSKKRNLLSLKSMLIRAQEEFQCLSKSESPSKSKRVKKELESYVNMQSLDSDAQSIDQEIAKHPFILTFEKFVLENQLKGSTALELFIKDKSQYLPTEVQEVQILSDHVSKLDKPNVEKKLIKVAQDLSKFDAKKESKFCPIIYFQDATTGGLVGIKIKNAFE